MTRLQTEWIQDMPDTVGDWSCRLEETTGMGFLALAAAVSGRSPEAVADVARQVRVAAVPITSGLGVIGSFARSIAAIIAELGFPTIVTQAADVAGLWEAKEKNAGIVFMADDDRYLAVNLRTNGFAENDGATAKGYILLLEAMAKKHRGCGLNRQDVLLLGYGRVGKRMEAELLAKGAKVTVYDNDPAKKKAMDPGKIKEFAYIADATNQGGWLTKEMLAPGALIAAPGVPYSLNEEAALAFAGTGIHDNLEIGTVAMLAQALEGSIG